MKIDRKFIQILKTGYYDNMELNKDLGFLNTQRTKRCVDCGKVITQYSKCKGCYFKSKDEAYL